MIEMLDYWKLQFLVFFDVQIFFNFWGAEFWGEKFSFMLNHYYYTFIFIYTSKESIFATFVYVSDWKWFDHYLYWIDGELCFAGFWVFWIRDIYLCFYLPYNAIKWEEESWRWMSTTLRNRSSSWLSNSNMVWHKMTTFVSNSA